MYYALNTNLDVISNNFVGFLHCFTGQREITQFHKLSKTLQLSFVWSISRIFFFLIHIFIHPPGFSCFNLGSFSFSEEI